MIPIKILVLICLMLILLKTQRPGLCAAIYVVIVFIFGLLFGMGFVGVMINTAIAGVFAFIYFWLLDRFRDTFTFWLIFIAGLVLGFI